MKYIGDFDKFHFIRSYIVSHINYQETLYSKKLDKLIIYTVVKL